MLWQDKEKVNEYAFVNGAVFIDFVMKEIP
jgi:hypothetical protein